jgi:hypothetical protein
MPSHKVHDHKLAEKANELYWHSGRSVNQIAEELDLSKSVLYGMVRPLPAERPCPACQAELVFANRTAMEKKITSCPACDFSGARPEPTEATSAPMDPTPRTLAPYSGGSGRLFWGSMFLGIAAALYFTGRRR